jgi:predicted Zn-dependent protease
VKATKQPDFRICPNCGARNKAKWEYCAKCSEPLAAVPLGDAGEGAAAADVAPEAAADAEPFPWGTLVTFVALFALGIVSYNFFSQPAVAPPPELFTIGTLPPSLPPPGPAEVKGPGEEDYEAGLKRLNANDPAGAAVLFARAASAASDNHLYRHALAVAQWQSGARAEAVESYQQALRLSPDNPTYRLNLAKALATTGRTREAVAEYEELVERHGGHVEAMQEAARLIAESDPEKARDLLRRAAAARPEDAVLKQQLAHVLEKTGDTEGASFMYQEILQTNPDAHITRGLLAEIHIRQGRPQDAIDLYRSGLQQYPAVPLLHRGLASALERSGAVAEAISEYREYARLAPHAPDAQQLRERADRLEKRVAPAAS